MKKYFIFTCFILLSQIADNQNIQVKSRSYVEKNRVYSSTNFYLKLYYSTGKYQIIQVKELEDSLISAGMIMVKNGLIIFNDDKKTGSFKMKQIDRCRLLSLNRTDFFKKSEILYLMTISDECGTIEQMSWKLGKRDGYWTIFSPKGITTIVYKNGVFKKTYLEYWSEIRTKTPEL